MEMYREHYAVAILQNGKVQKEVDSTVVLPFGSEYVVRLKNKSRKRAVADVHIDGRLAAKGVIVDSNGTLDLERFVIDNLNEGNRFKIVRKDDSRVEQPNELENGNVEVRFYAERDKPEVKVVEHYEYKHHSRHLCGGLWGHCSSCCNDFHCQRCYPLSHWPSRPHDGVVYYGSALSEHIGYASKGMSAGGPLVGAQFNSSPVALNNVSNVLRTTSLDAKGEDAATVEGSKSTQRFVATSIDVDYDHPVVLQIKLRGVNKVIDHCACGFHRTCETFCPRCGTQLAIGVAA